MDNQKTAHDNVVDMLTRLVDKVEADATPLNKLMIGAVTPSKIIEQIRQEQHYDPEVMCLLDRIVELKE